MTEKVMIIDGADVGECEFYYHGFCALQNKIRETLPSVKTCSKNEFCICKQLKRKEQECEYLKNCLDKSIKTQTDSELWWEKERKDLKTKLDQLKAENEELKQWQEDAEDILKTQLDNFDKVENRYKQALDEIEGLTQSTLDEFEYDDEGQQLSYCKDVSEQILNIINKAKDGE